MRPVAPAVVEDVGVVTTGVLKGVGENRHRAEDTRVVHLTSE